jgi:phosphatidylinositol alpha-mannosyltransferase
MGGELRLLAERMNIALVSPYDHSTPGGVRQHVINLDEQLRALGHQTRVLAPATSRIDLAANVVCLSQSIQTLTVSASRARLSLSPMVIARVRSALRAERFDIVHLHEPLIPMACLAALVFSSVPTVGTIHGYRDSSPLYRYARPMLAPLMQKLAARTAVSTDASRWASQYFPGDFTIISDGVDVRRFDGGTRTEKDQIVLFVGRLDDRKGFGYLLEAYASVKTRIPGATLVVAGAYSQDERSAWERVTRRRQISGVQFVGRVSDVDLPTLYQRAMVFCAPSTGFEALGIVLLEAMAAGVPIVTTDIEGYRTVVRDGVEAVVVPPRDSAALASALAELLLDPLRRRSLAAAGRERVALYDWPALAARYIDLYENVLRRDANGSH